MLKLLCLLPFLVNGTEGIVDKEIVPKQQCFVPWTEYTQSLVELRDEVTNPYEVQLLRSYDHAATCALDLAAKTAQEAAISCGANYATECADETFLAATEWAVLTSLNAGEIKKARDLSDLYQDTYLSHMDSLGESLKAFSRYLLLSPRHFDRCPARPSQSVVRTSISYDDVLYCEYWATDLSVSFTKIVGGPDFGPIVFKLLEMTMFMAFADGNETATLDTYAGLENAEIRYWEDDLGQSNVFITTHAPLPYTLFHASGYMDVSDLLAESTAVITAAER